ncbi:MAG: adenosylcobinamide-phosphate synthase [Cognaticolwellia sp.]
MAALLWDALFGEPPTRWHPVAWIGSTISWLRPKRLEHPARNFAWGLIVAWLLPTLIGLLGWAVMHLGWVGLPLAVFFCTTSFSIRCLGEASEKVAQPLNQGDLEGARAGLGWLCSRDPSQLSPSELSAGTIESVAENASDSAVAPLFWFAILGLPGLMAYRVVNTLDAMWGYRDEREWLGKASARLDDLLNWIPARITAALLLFADIQNAQRGAAAAWSDANSTDSPNAGWPMATMAGLLGVTLAKPGHYTLGTGPEPKAKDIGPAWLTCQRAMRTWGALIVITLLLGALYQLN